jgi:anti-sigma B factor antagonist
MKPPSPLEVTRSEIRGIPVLQLRGRITLGEGVRILSREISNASAQGHKYVLLEMSRVSYVDSSGLGALVASHNTLKVTGGAVGLVNSPERVREILRLTRLTIILQCFDDQESAARHFKPSD